jgi:hypothetical protein
MNVKFSSVEIIEREGKKYVQKTADEAERQITLDQITYLNSLPADLKSYFPKIEETYISCEKVSYLMPYYDLQHLDLTIDQKSVALSSIKNILDCIIKFMFINVYRLNRHECSSDFFDVVYVNRMVRRTEKFVELKPQCERLVKSEYLLINGKKCLNLGGIISELGTPRIKSLLSPRFISLIHGDLEVNHILYREDSKGIRFMLLDPRPNSNGGDLAYDIAKLYQAINGMSIAIELGNFSIEIKDADIPEVKFHITPNRDIEEYCFLKEHVNSLLSVLSESEGIDCLMERVMFAEASHFISAPPFYIDSEGSVAEALYIEGIVLLNKFWERMT